MSATPVEAARPETCGKSGTRKKEVTSSAARLASKRSSAGKWVVRRCGTCTWGFGGGVAERRGL